MSRKTWLLDKDGNKVEGISIEDERGKIIGYKPIEKEPAKPKPKAKEK